MGMGHATKENTYGVNSLAASPFDLAWTLPPMGSSKLNNWI
jgi:hypothetical protein